MQSISNSQIPHAPPLPTHSLSLPYIPPHNTQEETTEIRLQNLQKIIIKPYRHLSSIVEKEENDEDIAMNNQTIVHKIHINKQHLDLDKNESVKVYKKKSMDFFRLGKGKRKKSNTKLPSIGKKFEELNREKKSQSELSLDPLANGRIKNSRISVFQRLNPNSNESAFLKTTEKYELQFLELCSLRKYKNAEEILIKLLNYTIDLNLINYLCFSMKILADFYYEHFQTDQSFFYYNETRKCAILTGKFELMIHCLFKMSICSTKIHMFHESIKFLTTALKYIWFYDLLTLEMKVYDEIGKVYFTMGDTKQAKRFHQKFFEGRSQSKESSVRIVAKEFLIASGILKKDLEKNISSRFLWKVQMPIKEIDEMPEFGISEKSEKGLNSVRKSYHKSMKYFDEFTNIKIAISQVLEEDFFKGEIGDLSNESKDWTSPNRSSKLLSFDIQRNNHLQSLGIPYEYYFSKSKHPEKNLKVSERRVKTETAIEESNSSKKLDFWFKKIADDAIRKTRCHNETVLNRVQLRGMNKSPEPKIESLRGIYQQYFSLASMKCIDHSESNKEQE